MRITRLKILNYRGVASLETEVPESGVLVSGKKGGTWQRLEKDSHQT